MIAHGKVSRISQSVKLNKEIFVKFVVIHAFGSFCEVQNMDFNQETVMTLFAFLQIVTI